MTLMHAMVRIMSSPEILCAWGVMRSYLTCYYRWRYLCFSGADGINDRIRRPVRSLRIRCVVLPGLEPGQAEPKTAVLPLHHKTILMLSSRLKASALKAVQSYALFSVRQNIAADFSAC